MEADYFQYAFPRKGLGKTVPCPVRYWAGQRAAQPAIRVFEMSGDESAASRSPQVVSFADLDSRIEQIRLQLRAADPELLRFPGHVVRCPEESIAILFACFRERVPLVLLSNRLGEETVRRSAVQACVTALLSSGSPNEHDYSPLSKLPMVRLCGGSAAGMAQKGCAEDLETDIPATALFTSGSSSSPKLAVHSVRNHFVSARAACQRSPLVPSDSTLLSLGLFHIGGLGIIFRSLLSGSSITVPDKGWTVKAASLPGLTHVSLVATQLKQLLDETNGQLQRSLSLVVGGGPVPPVLITKAIRIGISIRTTYGLTELSSQVSTSDPWPTSRKEYPSGPMLRHCQCRVRDDGVLLIRGESVFLGYLEGGKVVPSSDPGGWFVTNDLARFVGNELYVSGRADSMFISGGENIQPEEIEGVLLSLGGIARAVVVGVKDDVFGFRPVAFLAMSSRAMSSKAMSSDTKSPNELSPGPITAPVPSLRRESSPALSFKPVELDQIRSKLSEILPGFKIPDHFFEWPADVQPVGLKDDRVALRKRAEELVEEYRQ